MPGEWTAEKAQKMFDSIDNARWAREEREERRQRERQAWASVTNLLPPRLQRAGFELTEDDNYLVLWHDHAFVARFLGIATNMPIIIRACDAHLETHPILVEVG